MGEENSKCQHNFLTGAEIIHAVEDHSVEDGRVGLGILRRSERLHTVPYRP